MRHLQAANILGEGVIWDDVNQCVWWTDIQASRFYSYTYATGKMQYWQLSERLCSFALYQPEVKRFIAAFATGFAIFAPETGRIDWLYCPDLAANVRFNDGRCDRQGRFWAGTMGEHGRAAEKPGELYCLERRSFAKVQLQRIGISNSLCWSPDGCTAYFADSLDNRIEAFDFDARSAAFSNRRLFVQLPADIYPDGSTVDAEGCLWNAQWGGGRIVRYRPDGKEDRVIELPVSQPSCLAFGGPDMNILFITTAREGLDAARLRKQPLAGSLLILETDIKGLPESRVRLCRSA